MTGRPLSRWLPVSLVVVVVAAAAGLYVMLRGAEEGERPAVILAPAEPDCDAGRRACTALAGERRIRFRLGPPVAVMQPLAVALELVQWPRDTIRTVTVEFDMTDMDMGQHRYRLARQADGRWTGTAVLPVCSTGRRDWTATVVLRTTDRHYRSRFRFQAGLPGGGDSSPPS